MDYFSKRKKIFRSFLPDNLDDDNGGGNSGVDFGESDDDEFDDSEPSES